MSIIYETLDDVAGEIEAVIGGGYVDEATVRAVQRKLLAAGVQLPRYGADGKYGKETAAAIKFWRRAYALDPENGLIDDDLLHRLGLNPPLATVASPSSPPAAVTSEPDLNVLPRPSGVHAAAATTAAMSTCAAGPASLLQVLVLLTILFAFWAAARALQGRRKDNHAQ